jgi:hypothetical protein
MMLVQTLLALFLVFQKLQIGSAFRKGYQQTFSDEVFIVDKVVYTPPVHSYLLKTSGEDVPVKFLQPHLTKTKFYFKMWYKTGFAN